MHTELRSTGLDEYVGMEVSCRGGGVSGVGGSGRGAPPGLWGCASPRT